MFAPLRWIGSTSASSGDVTYAKTTDPSAPTLAQATSALLRELPAHYRDVADHLKIIDPAHVFITEYPDETTAANGQTCTGTQGPFPRFLQSTWAWLHQTGTALDKAVAATSSLQWTPVTGIADRLQVQPVWPESVRMISGDKPCKRRSLPVQMPKSF